MATYEQAQEGEQREWSHVRAGSLPQLRRHQHAEKGAQVLRDRECALQSAEVCRLTIQVSGARLHDRERGPVPKTIAHGEGHELRVTGRRDKLQCA